MRKKANRRTASHEPLRGPKDACPGFKFRGRSLPLGGRSYLVGILNVTPDSFSDGAIFLRHEDAVRHAVGMIDEGADIVDVGGESTRPGATPVPADEEIRRIVPVISEIKRLRPDAVVSADTYKGCVAEKALAAGADIINDVSGLRLSKDMARIAAEHDAGLVLMHMRGTPETMAGFARYGDLIGEVADGLGKSAEKALRAGVRRESIALDPGIGFAKTPEQSLELLSKIDRFRRLGYPLFVGPSRKSFIGSVLGRKEPSGRIWGTAGAVAWLVLHGVDFVRVHDAREMADVMKVIEALKKSVIG